MTIMETLEIDTLYTTDFWYDLFEGGYIRPEKLLANPTDVENVKNAIKILEDFQRSVIGKNIIIG